MAGQLLESKHSLLQARVEHLELDLAFKARVGVGIRLETEMRPCQAAYGG